MRFNIIFLKLACLLHLRVVEVTTRTDNSKRESPGRLIIFTHSFPKLGSFHLPPINYPTIKATYIAGQPLFAGWTKFAQLKLAELVKALKISEMPLRIYHCAAHTNASKKTQKWDRIWKSKAKQSVYTICTPSFYISSIKVEEA